MGVFKYTKSDVNRVDLGTKVIDKYPTPVKELDMSIMRVSGRSPEKGFLLEHQCQFFIYVTKGNGRVITEQGVVEVGLGDVVFVEKETKFAIEGQLEYISAGTPAFFPEQAEEVE